MIPITCQCGEVFLVRTTGGGTRTKCPRCAALCPIPAHGDNGNPAADLLAGAYVYIEAEEDLTVRPGHLRRGAAPKAEHPASENPLGVNLEFEG